MVEWQTRRTQNAMPRGVPVQVRPRVSDGKKHNFGCAFFMLNFNNDLGIQQLMKED